MSWSSLSEPLVLVVLLLAIAKPLGSYMAAVL